MPHGFLIGVCHDVDGKKLIMRDGQELEVVGTLTKPGENTPGPYICIVLVGQRGTGEKFEALRAFVHPVKSAATLVMVDSNLERLTLDVLLGQQRYQSTKLATPFRVVKPLLDIAVGAASERVRPDFILEYESHKVVVETIGYTDDEYLARKKRTHAMMAKIGPVVEHGPTDDSDKTFKAQLRTLRTATTATADQTDPPYEYGI